MRRTHGIGQHRQPVGEKFLRDAVSDVASLVTIETKSISRRRPVDGCQVYQPHGHRRIRVRRVRRARSRSCCAACSNGSGFPWSRATAARTSRCIRRATSTSSSTPSRIRSARSSRRRTGPRCARWRSASRTPPPPSSAPSRSAPSRIAAASGPMELNIPAIVGIGGSLIYFVDRYGDRSIYDVDFKPVDTAAAGARRALCRSTT